MHRFAADGIQTMTNNEGNSTPFLYQVKTGFVEVTLNDSVTKIFLKRNLGTIDSFTASGRHAGKKEIHTRQPIE